MTEPKCPACGAPHTPQDLARKLKTSAEAVLDHEQQNPGAMVYVPAHELQLVCEQFLATPAAPPETKPDPQPDHESAA